ncbi:MAG: type IV-A pilus assembly ATPase PilB [Armatimonadota bacterium]|nr:type IV-A pilus assembly ATPase PilB [Armatimonadota bacterium]MDR7528744.1 type IV-A pilus assembly ATPase PilB [Armatimonadota bacterium]
MRLLDLLTREGLLTPDQARRVGAEQQKTGERLAQVLGRLGYLAEGQFLDFLSRKYGIPVINLERMEVPEEVTRLIRPELVQKYQVFPLRQVGSTLTLALSDPTIILAIDDVQFATGLHVVPVLASEAAVRDAIERHYQVEHSAHLDELLRTEQQLGADALELVERTQKVDIGELGEQAGAAPVIRLVNLILADAIRKRASDIHLEPQDGVFQVRYRIDGVLHDVMAPPKTLEPAIVSRVKIMANLDIAERRLPQDGRISVRLGAREVDVRVSTLPTTLGEKVVLRILDRAGVVLDLGRLGFEDDDRARFERAIRTPYGMILVTGPTGSGKSTTLYAAVSVINHPDINILTVEDPVEFNLPRVNQVQVREDIGLTFSAALRAFLRQDPDVILVGEMRDTETAQIAVRAALTGHLVFSTLHTNDAPSTVTRLLDMGIPPFLVSSSLLLVVAQRLCRRICLECREVVEPPFSVLLEAGFTPEEAEAVRLYRGSGCHACAGTGYRGRTAIHEILEVTPEIQEAIVAQRPAADLRAIALKQGLRTLRQSGLRKAARGITTLDEVLRVTHGA